MGLDVGEALPLVRLSPITRTISLTDTPCNSGGKFLVKKKNNNNNNNGNIQNNDVINLLKTR
jgi:hypothetical protein